MENCGDLNVASFTRLMQEYLDGSISANQYRQTFFDFNKRRVDIPDELADRIIQQAYGDADDYDPVVRLPYTIGEDELRERVTKSFQALVALGYSVGGTG